MYWKEFCVSQSVLIWCVRLLQWIALKKCSISLAILKNRLWKLTRMTSIYDPEQNLPGVFTAMHFSKRIYWVFIPSTDISTTKKKHSKIWLLASTAKDFHFSKNVAVIQYNKWMICVTLFATRIKLFYNTFLLLL